MIYFMKTLLVSYFTGPSVAYDTNWVTGLEVLRLACDSIKKGECEAAIVGAANLVFFEHYHLLLEEMNLLSPDGKTRAFDANGKL